MIMGAECLLANSENCAARRWSAPALVTQADAPSLELIWCRELIASRESWRLPLVIR